MEVRVHSCLWQKVVIQGRRYKEGAYICLQAYSVQEFSPPKDYTFDKNKEENEKLFGPKQYFLVNARRAN